MTTKGDGNWRRITEGRRPDKQTGHKPNGAKPQKPTQGGSGTLPPPPKSK